jgi:hypothetical protein
LQEQEQPRGGKQQQQQQQQQQEQRELTPKQQREAAAKEEAVRTRTWVESVGPRPGEQQQQDMGVMVWGVCKHSRYSRYSISCMCVHVFVGNIMFVFKCV